MEHVYNRRRRQPLSALENPPVREERPVCSLFEQCKSCPYPRHGFICWNRDESTFAQICKKSIRKRRESTVDMRELEYWKSLIEHSIQRWKEDSITRLNSSDRLYYIGGENGL